MSLSYYPNCPASHDDQLDLDGPPPTMLDHLLTPPPPPPPPPPSDNSFNDFYNHHQLFDPNDLFYSSENPNHFPNEFLPDHNFDCGPKLQKHYPDHCFVDIDPFFFNDGLFPNPSYNYYEAVWPESTALPEFPNGPPGYSNGICEGQKERTGLSAQSIAARQRRRKITEKTRELGKLVPGGQKMNTAEMLQAAYKYIKFLQAQVGILEFVRSHRQAADGETSADNDKLHDLLVSEAIQEKLYSTEKCLLPNKFVEEISVDDRIVRDNPQLVSIVKHEV